MDGLQLKVLGPLEVWRDGTLVPVPAARQRNLLVALALRAGRMVTSERLVTLLWGDEPPVTARNTLQTLVRRLRRLLVPDLLRTRPGGYLLAVERDQVDAYRFEALLRTGREALAGGDPAAAVPILDEALDLWRGQALADVTSDELRLVEAPRLAELRQQAVEDRIEARLSRGETAGLVAELRALVAEHPLRERPYEQLMTALYKAGRRAEALATYRALRATLAEQLGVEPGDTANRLHQAMLRGDPALTAPAGPAGPAEPPPIPAELPAEVAGFVGRAEQLARLDGLAAARLVAVVGTAGVGKTALVLRWAHRLRERYPDGQLYVDLCGFSATAPLRPAEVLGRFLRDLGVPPPQVPADEAEAAARYRTLLADRRVLVVLDNARDAGQVRPLLPGGTGCLAVVTSRDRLDSLVAYEGAARLRLDPLPDGESQALLAHLLGRTPLADEPAAAGDLARLCAHLPLALRIAAAGVAGRQADLAGYVALLREQGLDGLALVDDPQAAVRATFDLSYAALADPAQRLFRLFGCLPGVDLTGESAAALAGVDRGTAARLLDRLGAAHLLAEDAGRFGCHDLLRDYAVRLARAMPQAERGAAARRLIEWYVAAAEAAADLVRPDRLRLPAMVGDARAPVWGRADQAVAWLDAERHSLAMVAQHAAGFGMPAAAWRLAGCLRSYLIQRGHLPELLAISRAALAAAESAGDPTGRAVAHLALGTAHFVRQHHELAVGQYRRAEECARAAGWQEGRAVALHSLGNAYQGAGRRAEAARSYARALDLQERLGLVHDRAATLTNVGNTRWELGELDEAVDYYRQAVTMYRAAGRRTWQLGIVLGNTGSVLSDLGRPDEALGYLTEALGIHQELGNRVSEAMATHMLAAVHREAGRLSQAAELAGGALRLAREIGDRVAEAFALSTVATIHQAGGAHQAALTANREALALARRLGHTHLAAQVHLDLAATFRALGEHDLAGSHAAQALTIARDNDYRLLARQAYAALAAGAGGPVAVPAVADQPS
jgi:DNA-binding SARP family transcriptional activator/tetratricopeptide (TPR) repeat protein